MRTVAPRYQQAHYDERVEFEILKAAEKILQRRAKHGELIADPHAAGRIFNLHLAARSSEVFSVMFLDARHRMLAIEDLFMGTIDGCEVHPREVGRAALRTMPRLSSSVTTTPPAAPSRQPQTAR